MTSEDLLLEAQHLARRGQVPAAAEIYHRILRTNPRHFEALSALGAIYFRHGQFDRAQYLLAEASKIDPLFTDGLCLRGIALLQMNRHSEALACFDRALAVRPDFVEALCNRGIALQEMQRYDEALATFDTAVAIQPRHALSWNNRGSTLAAMQRNAEALEDFERALEIDPDLKEARENREQVSFKLGRTSRAPAVYLQHLFDRFSTFYDDNMLKTLGYVGHTHLRKLAERVVPGIAPPLRILDLGTGTGLVGEAFKDLAAGGCLDGIDLAPLMIEKARERGVYNDLILGDLEVVLMRDGPSYDLILSADTMIYIGDLAPTLTGVARRLRPGGFYFFMVESGDGESWEFTANSRYRHGPDYLRAAAARAGLEFVDIMDCTLRTELSVPVPGFGVALSKPVA